jgi:hypothetical protein
MAISSNKVEFILDVETESYINSKTSFLSKWDFLVSFLQELTGNFPGSHKDSYQEKLRFKEVPDSDPEVLEKIAVWSPSEKFIKLNKKFKDYYRKAISNNYIVAELSEALGDAALQFQNVNHLNDNNQVLGTKEFTLGLKRYIGMYAIINSSDFCSSCFDSGVLYTHKVFLNDYMRCCRKRRLGLIGDYLSVPGSSLYADSDISYGMFIDLFQLVDDQDKLSEFIKKGVENIVSLPNYASRSNKQKFRNFMSELSEVLKLNLTSAALTWGFTDLDFSFEVYDEYTDPFSTASVEMSPVAKTFLNSKVVDRETKAQELPRITTGCSDSFGLGLHDSAVVVLKDLDPSDQKSYKEKKAYLLGNTESNSIFKEIGLPCDLGQVISKPITVLIPEGKLPNFTYKDYVKPVNLAEGYELIYCKLIHLGHTNPSYKITVITDGAAEDEFITKDIEIPLYTYALIAFNSYTNSYSYINGKTVQLLTAEEAPKEIYYDPVLDENVLIPGGKELTVKTMLASLDEDGFISRSFSTYVEIFNSSGNSLGIVESPDMSFTDPSFYLVRERPSPRSTSVLDMYSGLINQVDKIKTSAYTNSTISILGHEHVDSLQESTSYSLVESKNKVIKVNQEELNKREEYTSNTEVIIQDTKIKNFVNSISENSADMPVDSAEKEFFKFRKVLEFYNSLSEDETLSVFNLKSEYKVQFKNLDNIKIKNVYTNSEVELYDILYALPKLEDIYPSEFLDDDGLIQVAKYLNTIIYNKKLDEQKVLFSRNSGSSAI